MEVKNDYFSCILRLLFLEIKCRQVFSDPPFAFGCCWVKERHASKLTLGYKSAKSNHNILFNKGIPGTWVAARCARYGDRLCLKRSSSLLVGAHLEIPSDRVT